jgi:hypothetical protein
MVPTLMFVNIVDDTVDTYDILMLNGMVLVASLSQHSDRPRDVGVGDTVVGDTAVVVVVVVAAAADVVVLLLGPVPLDYTDVLLDLLLYLPHQDHDDLVWKNSLES